MNAYVKEIGDLCGITKPMHMHNFRHTFASILINRHVPLEVISKACGHSNTKITESVYAKFETDTIKNTILAAMA